MLLSSSLLFSILISSVLPLAVFRKVAVMASISLGALICSGCIFSTAAFTGSVSLAAESEVAFAPSLLPEQPVSAAAQTAPHKNNAVIFFIFILRSPFVKAFPYSFSNRIASSVCGISSANDNPLMVFAAPNRYTSRSVLI